MKATTLQKMKDAGELFMPGHRACIGCGEVLAMRQVCKALGKDIIIVNATGCMEIISSPFPTTNWMVPWVHALFENNAAVASGIESGLEMMKRKGRGPAQEVTVVAMGGDGATFDIGIQALSGALERGHNFIYVCFDNEGYMNTGIQRTSSTPYGATTTTSPHGKNSIGQTTEKKDMPLIALAHHIPYVATMSPSYPTDLARKVKKAKEIKGPAFLHVFSVCPTGWGISADSATCPTTSSTRSRSGCATAMKRSNVNAALVAGAQETLRRPDHNKAALTSGDKRCLSTMITFAGDPGSNRSRPILRCCCAG